MFLQMIENGNAIEVAFRRKMAWSERFAFVRLP